MPNGEGTLRQILNPAEQPHTVHGYGEQREYYGNFVNGVAEGDFGVIFSWYGLDVNHACQPTILFTDGIADSNDLICNDCSLLLLSDIKDTTLGVPPWAGPFLIDAPDDSMAAALPDGPATFSDPSLEAAIRAWLGDPSGEIMTSDLEKITTFYLSYDEAFSEVGIRFWGNGSYVLDEFFYPTQDMPQSFGDFDQFPHIREIEIYYHPSLDLNSIAAMERITELSLMGCGITDVSPLRSMAQLETLTLAENESLTDISPLAGMNLRFLNIVETSVSDISTLAGMDSLTSIDLRRCPVIDYTPLANLPNLAHISLPSAAWRYLAPIAHVENLWFDGYPANKLPTPPGAHPAMNNMMLQMRQDPENNGRAYREGDFVYYYPTEVYYYTPDSAERQSGPAPDGMYVVYDEPELAPGYAAPGEYYGLYVPAQAMLGVPSVTAAELKSNYCGNLLIEGGGNPFLLIEGIKYELVEGGSAFMVTMDK